ncbi:MAG: phenylacetate--CoA ligase family protein [Lachnospiraceae bacterium]|nr:phenylacetate--CoA ligase family protein [Lachnospiraceae bacterium]
MGIALLKKLNESMPDFLKIMVAPIIRNKLINNKVFVEQIKMLEDYEKYSDKEKSDFQLNIMRNVLVHAYEHTEYYKKIFDEVSFNPYEFKDFEEIKVIPLLSKEIIKENSNKIEADDVSDYYVGVTGGSTGEPLKVLLDRDSIYKEKAFIYYFWSKYGYDIKKSKIVTFRGVDFKGKMTKVNPLYNEIIFNPFILTYANIDKYVKKINKYKPEFIHGYPSAMANFCRLLIENKLSLKVKIKAAFAISEECTVEQQKVIEQALGCKVISFYGHTERAVFGEQVGYERLYKFNDIYGYTELLEHEAGNVVCTGYINYKFPFIRYVVDDHAQNSNDKGYFIEPHRKGATLIGINGERISQSSLRCHDASTFSGTTGYQMYQKEYGKVECRVQAVQKISEQKINMIKKGLEEKTGKCIDWKVIQVDEFELTERGKCKTIIQKCKEKV